MSKLKEFIEKAVRYKGDECFLWPYSLDDKWKHGTVRLGEKHQNSKLTNKDILSIRSKKGLVTQTVLAVEYNISQAQVSRIQQQVQWRHF